MNTWHKFGRKSSAVNRVTKPNKGIDNTLWVRYTKYMIKFRHYKTGRMSDYFFGIVFYDRRQPTLDIIIGKHVFVAFWSRRDY